MSTTLKGWYWFVTEYGMVYRCYVFRDDGWHRSRGERAFRSRAMAERLATQRLRALSEAS